MDEDDGRREGWPVSWCRLEDDMDENRKLRRLSHEAFRLYWIAVPYARRHETAGRLHMDDVRDLCARHRIKNPRAAVAELLRVPTEYGFEHGCWEEVEPGVYEVHDHEEYSPPTSKERMRAKRARERSATEGPRSELAEREPVTSPPVTSDAPVTSRPVTNPVTSDGLGDAAVTDCDTPRAQPRAGYPDPVPEPDVPNGTPVPVPVPDTPHPPVLGGPLPLPLPPGLMGRVEALRDGCLEVLAARPLRTFERDLVQGWGTTLRRDGELVPVDEVLTVVRRKMAEPTREGGLAANLGWCADDVAALARSANVTALATLPRSVQEAVATDRMWAERAVQLRQEGR